MSEHNVFVKQEVEDSSYDFHVNEVLPDTASDYVDSTEFVSVKTENEASCSSLIIDYSQIKEEPLDLTSTRGADSPQLPDSTTDQFKSESCHSMEVEVTLELLPQSEQNHHEYRQNESESKAIKQSMDEKSKKNEIKTKFVIEDGKFSCLICQKIYMTKASIVRHLLKHTEKDFVDPPILEDTHKCDKCGKTFKNVSNLQQHSFIHLDKKQFKCEQCLRCFTLKSNLIRHQGKSQCKLPDVKIVCNVCNKTFSKETSLKSHLKKHSLERPFGCNDCGMSFKFKSTLVRHLQHHNGVKPYSCSVCNKQFAHYGLIKPHMRMHTGERPYTCPICSKTFSYKHNMLRHSVRHDRVVNLNCPVCDKKFPKESRLKYHMRTHMDEKCFSCGICPKKFSHRQNVIRHYSRKHPNCMYESTDTDASVALKLWNELKSNKRPLPTKDTNKRNVKKCDEEKNEIEEDLEGTNEEEILPDIKETPMSFDTVHVKVESEDGE